MDAIDDTFNIEDEELDEIEYLEILTLDEIIKENPSFIAYNDKELYNVLFNIFGNEQKAIALKNLFFAIIANDKKMKGIRKKYENYTFVADARKKDYEELDKEADAEYFNNLAKLSNSRYIEAKNRYFFALEYDDSKDGVKIKADDKINIEVYTKDRAEFPVNYPVYASDDAYIPIMGVYYSVPYATELDYMYKKIISHYFNKKHINYVGTDGFGNIGNVLQVCRPSIENLFELDDIIDYESLDNFLRRYDIDLNFLNEDNFKRLCDFVKGIINDNERKNIYKAFKIKRPELINNKMVFFDRLITTMKLLRLSQKTMELLENLKHMINEAKMSDLSMQAQLMYNNIHDIIENINNGNMTLEQVVDNIKAVQKTVINNYSLDTINNLAKTNEELEEIAQAYESIRDDFVYSRTHLFNYENDNKKFVSFFHESKDIIDGNNEDNYEGIPAILKNNDYEEFEEMGEDDIVVNEDTGMNGRKKELDKYWLNLKYKDEQGFIELVKILLPVIDKIVSASGITVDYFLLTEELFNMFRAVATKVNILKHMLEEASIVIGDNIIDDIARINPHMALATDLNMGKELRAVILEANKEYVKVVNDAFVKGLAWIILNIQERILDNSISIDENYLNPMYVDKWYTYGAPLVLKEKNGVIPYMMPIIGDVIAENNDFMIDKNYAANISTYIEKDDKIEELRKRYTDVKNKKVEKGVLMQKIMIENIKNKKYDKIASDYIDALVYMPGVNYKKIHKFLLGCCLQKIGYDYKADIDLHENQRRDLIDIKKRFATRKETNKKRYMRFVPVSVAEEAFEEDNEIEYMLIDEYRKKTTSINVQDWLEGMKTKNALLPDNIIDEFKNNTRKCVEYISDYIKILQTTARYRNSDLPNLFMVGKINYKSILLRVLKILNSGIYDDENIVRIQSLAVESLRHMMIELSALNALIGDDTRQDIERINAFICARAMCLPCNPDMNVNKYLVSLMNIPAIFIEDNAKNIHNTILNHLKMAKFPTVQEITDFLNSKREENKQMKLNILNNKSVEENQLISKLKKAGIKNNLMEQDDNDINDNTRDDNDIDNDNNGEEEYKMQVEDDEYDDDNLDRMEMGFIYS